MSDITNNPRPTPRNPISVYARRNEIARERGFSSYNDARKWRSQTREMLQDLVGVSVPTRSTRSVDWILLLDRLALVVKTVTEAAGASTWDQLGSGLNQEQLFDPFQRIVDQLLPGRTTDDIWQIIRDFYPPRDHSAAA